MKKRAILILILALFLLISFVVLVVSQIFISQNYFPYDSSFTKAICDKENSCQDYKIFCKEKRAVSISPITGAVIQFSKDWEDPRSEEIISRFC